MSDSQGSNRFITKHSTTFQYY